MSCICLYFYKDRERTKEPTIFLVGKCNSAHGIDCVFGASKVGKSFTLVTQGILLPRGIRHASINLRRKAREIRLDGGHAGF